MKLEINRLKKSFADQGGVGPIDVSLNCQTVVLIGPSGSGKSTLLRIVAGLQYPDEGSLTLNDVPIVFEEKSLMTHRRKLGIVFQSWNLFPHLTALENIMLPLTKVHGLSEEEALQCSVELLKRFALDKHAYKKPYELSGGQSQRVALIRAVAIKPKMLVLDEPTSALDPLMTYEVLELVLEMKKEGLDILLATHHYNFAKLIADQIIFLADGKLVESGSPHEIFENPNSAITKQYVKIVDFT